MTLWRLDIDEGNIYFGDRMVAALNNGNSNDEWREAIQLGTLIVEAMNALTEFGEATKGSGGH